MPMLAHSLVLTIHTYNNAIYTAYPLPIYVLLQYNLHACINLAHHVMHLDLLND